LAAGLATTTAIIGAVVYGQTSGHKFSLTKIAEGFGTSLANLFSPKNTNAAIYSLLSAGLGVYSLVLLFGSHEVDSQSHLSTAALSHPLSTAPGPVSTTNPYLPKIYLLLPPAPPSLIPLHRYAILSTFFVFFCSAPAPRSVLLACPLLISLHVLHSQ
jgi:hypothetical protein